MFCPNCGVKNRSDQNYCRGCGLKLDAIVQAVSDQFPSKEFLEMQRRTENFHRIGAVCLVIAGVVGFSLLMFKAAEYKQELFGPEILLWSAIGALIGFLLLSVFFFNIPRFFRKVPPHEPDGNPPAAHITAKLIEDRPSDYVSSVTENTTNKLATPHSDSKA